MTQPGKVTAVAAVPFEQPQARITGYMVANSMVQRLEELVMASFRKTPRTITKTAII